MSDAVLRAFIVIAAVIIIFLSYGVMVDAQTTREAFDDCMISEHKVEEVFESMNLRVYFKEGSDSNFIDLTDVSGIKELDDNVEIANEFSTGPFCLTKDGGVFNGPSGKETWYNRPMGKCIDYLTKVTNGVWSLDDYHVDEERGIKMIGNFIMCAADTEQYPIDTVIETSLGTALVVDHCEAGNIDICTTW